MAEGVPLETVCLDNIGTVGSNPTLSAIIFSDYRLSIGNNQSNGRARWGASGSL